MYSTVVGPAILATIVVDGVARGGEVSTAGMPVNKVKLGQR